MSIDVLLLNHSYIPRQNLISRNDHLNHIPGFGLGVLNLDSLLLDAASGRVPCNYINILPEKCVNVHSG